MIWFIALGIVLVLCIVGEWKPARDLFFIFLILFLVRVWIDSYIPH